MCRCLEVVGMVIAPLLTPEGAPAGLSLVCSIAEVLTAIGRMEHSSAALSVARPPSPTLPPCRESGMDHLPLHHFVGEESTK